MNYLLHIDTSADLAVVAVSGDGQLVIACTGSESRNHAAALNQMIDNALADTGISFAQLSAVAVCAGPGSYTGLRIGMATAKGLCYVLNIPLILDNKLYLLAYDAVIKTSSGYARYVSLMVAREKEYFIAVYDNALNRLVDPVHVIEEDLERLVDKKQKTYFITNAPEGVISALDMKDCHVDNSIKPEVNNWCSVGFEKYICNNIVNLSVAEPFYLKQVYTRK